MVDYGDFNFRGHGRLILFVSTESQAQHLLIHEFIHAEISLRRNTKERRIDELLVQLEKGDVLLVAELSRLGRNMLEILNIIHELSQNGVQFAFVRQPELSPTGPHTKLLLAIYSYFAEAEWDYISIRTKQGLAAVRAKGQPLGRPKGSRNKERILDPYKAKIRDYLQMKLNLAAIQKIVNHQLEKPVSYNSLKYLIQHDEELLRVWQAQKEMMR